MKIEKRKVKDLLPYANNARVHSQHQIEQIAASIQEFGFNAPVLIDEGNTIIAGHGRVLAAQQLGLKDVPCVVLSHLSDRQKKAYILADNKLSLNASWDFELLSAELSSLAEADMDLSLTGFDEQELDSLMKDSEAILPATKYEVQGSQPGVETNFQPNLNPMASNERVTDEDIQKANARLQSQFESGEKPKHEVTCPECAHTFFIDK